MKKSRIISLIALLAASFMLLIGTVFAWFVIYDSMGGAELIIAKIDSVITLSKGVDRNYDGNLDPLLGDDGVTVIGYKYQELEGNPMYVTGQEAAEVKTSMQMADLMPSQKHTFKFTIINRSDARNVIRLSLMGYDTSFLMAGAEGEEDEPLYGGLTGADFDLFMQYLRVMSVTVKVGGDDSQTVKIYFASVLKDVEFKESSNSDDRIFAEIINLIEGVMLNSVSGENELDLYMIFTFEPYENLIKPLSQGGAGLTQSDLTWAEYNSYSGVAFKLPLIRIYLEVPS